MVKKKYVLYWASAFLFLMSAAERLPLLTGMLFSAASEKPHFVLSWPVPPQHISRISSTFGESRLDHFHNGVDIPGKGLPIFPLAGGRIIYQTSGVAKEGELPFGGGATIIMDHNDYWSGYMHLQEDTLPRLTADASYSQEISVQQTLGLSGDSGHSGGAHLHFFIYDANHERMYNPIPYLPQTVFQDHLPPRINSFLVKLPDKVSQVDVEKSFTLSQDFPILASLDDQGTNPYDRWGVYFLKVYNQEKESVPIKEVKFDYLTFKNGKWLTSDFSTFEDIYFLNYYVLGNRFRDSKVLRIESGGLSGPSFKKTYSLQINP